MWFADTKIAIKVQRNYRRLYGAIPPDVKAIKEEFRNILEAVRVINKTVWRCIK